MRGNAPYRQRAEIGGGVEHDDGLSPLVRALLMAKAAAVAGLVTAGLGLRPLDVALWTVLSGVAVLGLLALIPLLRRPPLPLGPREDVVVVLPDRSAATSSVPDPAVQARSAAVDLAREALVAARQRAADLDELVSLAEVLHEATLDLARATLSAGGWVEPALRHELTLRDRGPMAPVEPPLRQG